MIPHLLSSCLTDFFFFFFHPECTYDQPSNRKRMPDIRRVETKLKCAESLIAALLPGVDVYNPNFNLQAFLDSIQKARVSSNDSIPGLHSSLINIAKLGLSSLAGVSNEIDEDTGLPRGSLVPFNKSQTGSHHSLALNQNLNSAKYSSSIPSTSEDAENNVLNTLYSPQSTYGSPDNLAGREIKIILPPKHVASELIEAVWDNACVLFRFYHRPSFIRDLDLLYETDPDDYTNKQYKILPLVYSVMAVGVLFSMDKSERLGFKDASEGYKYFVAARKLIDIADARDTYAIQSIVMMIIFLQCSARLSTCYSYIGVALRSALRAGLHRKVAYNFNPIELETRKRLFWTIRKMDIYVNAMLGLPRSIAEEDFDQELPEEIDDENITEDGYFPQKEGKISSAGIANAHTRLITILSHVMKQIYPVKQESTNTEKSPDLAPLYNVAHAKVTEMEGEIRTWLDSLPIELRPGVMPPPEYLKANRLLHLALCHIQIVLYRPFIHYCSPKFGGDEQARTSALSCIKVSRTAMHIAHDLVSKNLLNGAYWFSIYTIFFSVACLVYYVHENPHDAEALEIRRDAELGKNALTSLKDSSMAAQRTYNLLNTLFEQLNRRTAKIPVSGSETPLSTSQSAASTPGSTTNNNIQNVSQFLHSVASGSMPSHSPARNDNHENLASQLYNKVVSNSQASSQQPGVTRAKRGRPPNSARRGIKRTSSAGNVPTSNKNVNGSSIDLSNPPVMAPPSRPSSVASTPAATSSTNFFGTPGSQITSPASNLPVKNTGLHPNMQQGQQGLDLAGSSDNIFSGLPDFGLDTTGLGAIESNVPPANPNNLGTSSSNVNSRDGRDQSSIENPVNTESPHLYVPGIMDQVDAQLFGRFLPPYMLQQTQAMPLGISSGPHLETGGSNDIKNDPIKNTTDTASKSNGSGSYDDPLDVLMGSSQPLYNNNNSFQSINGNFANQNSNSTIKTNPATGDFNNSNTTNDNKTNNNTNHNGSNFDANGVLIDSFGNADDRRLSLSSLFSKDWEDLLGQHNELSGLNSFMTQ